MATRIIATFSPDDVKAMGPRFDGLMEAMRPLMNMLAGESALWVRCEDGGWHVLTSHRLTPQTGFRAFDEAKPDFAMAGEDIRDGNLIEIPGLGGLEAYRVRGGDIAIWDGDRHVLIDTEEALPVAIEQLAAARAYGLKGGNT